MEDREIQLILAQALSKQSVDRAAFLDEVCGGDAELRARIDEMLAESGREEDEDEDDDEEDCEVSDPPERIGDYEVIRQLGRGGMGVVYLARDAELDREVAIKRLQFGSMPHPDAIARFQREMKAVAKLSDRNIVTAYHSGEDENGNRYLVMEYVPGSDLATTIRNEGPALPVKAIDWILQAARGLQHAHKLGIVHRDVKPANLLLDDKGTVKILDLGLARLETLEGEAGGTLTLSGMVMGTPDFMAPEQASETKEADQRSDIYSLGGTLYFLLTGRPAFKGKTAFRTIQSHVEDPIPRLEGGAAELDAVFQKMMAKDPGGRYQSMAEVVEALEACARDSRTGEELPRPGKGRLGWWIGCGVAAAVAIVAGVTLLKSPVTPIPVTDERGLALKAEATGGGGTFVDSGQRLGTSYSTELKLGDLDGDGDLDCVVANYKDRASRVWLNNGGGAFVAGATLGQGMATSLDLGDLDRDGDLDAVITDRNALDTVWLNDGKGAFVQWGEGMLTQSARNVILGDLDGDGILDAVISQGGMGSREANSIWFGDGDGRFRQSEQRIGQEATWEAGLGDLDGDGDLDVVFANGDRKGTEGTLEPNTVWLNDGSGTFEDSEQQLGNSFTRGVTLGDLDGDGDLDMVFANGVGEAATIWFNDGEAVFSRSDQTHGTGQERGAVLPDLDGDGDLDLVLFGAETANIRLLNDGKGTFSNPETFGPEAFGGTGDAGDLDGDGDWDVILTGVLIPANQVWLNETVSKSAAVDEQGLPLKSPPAAASEARFLDSGQRLGDDWSVCAKLGDLDRDGDLDAVVANYQDGIDRVWLNDGIGKFGKGYEFGRGESTGSVGLGDLDDDGDLDVILTERDGVDRVFLNGGDANFTQAEGGVSVGMTRSVTLGDLDGDGNLDAVISSGGTGDRTPNTIWFGDGAGNFDDTGQKLGDGASWGSALADLDGDGDLDIVFATGDDRGEMAMAGNTIWLNDGRGRFEESGEPFSPGLSRGVALGDFDGDGDLDALVGNDMGAFSGAWMNEGNLKFFPSKPTLGGSHTQPILADLDTDGDLDGILLSHDRETGNAIWLNDGDGNFGEPFYFGDTSGNHAGDVGDLDGDGDWDLFLPRKGGNEIWLNE